MKILIKGYYGFDNIGDELMLSVLISKLKKRKNAIITVMTRKPEIISHIHKIQTFTCKEWKEEKKLSFASWMKIFTAIKNTDIFMWGGGSFIQDIGKRKYRNILSTVIMLFVARLFLKKTALISIGIGPLRSKIGIEITKWIIRLSNLITVRDKDSFIFLKRLVPTYRKIFLTEDLALCAEIPDVRVKEKSVGLSFLSYYSYMEYNKIKDSILKDISIKLIENLQEKGYTVYCFPFQKKKGGKDLEFFEDISKKVKNIKIVKEHFNDISKVFTLLSSMELLIGMRYHFLLIGAMLNKRLIGIGYQIKVRSLMKRIGAPIYFDLEEVVDNPELIVKNIKKALPPQNENFFIEGKYMAHKNFTLMYKYLKM